MALCITIARMPDVICCEADVRFRPLPPGSELAEILKNFGRRRRTKVVKHVANVSGCDNGSVMADQLLRPFMRTVVQLTAIEILAAIKPLRAYVSCHPPRR